MPHDSIFSTFLPYFKPGISSRSVTNLDGASGLGTGGETLQSQIQRNMKASSVVLCCITPKYLQSDNCNKDLTLAETFQKPIIPIMLTSVELSGVCEGY